MLSRQDKIEIFSNILDQEEKCYADSFNSDIFISGQNIDFKNLEKLQTHQEIEAWIHKLKHRLVMREDEATMEDIIDDYICCG